MKHIFIFNGLKGGEGKTTLSTLLNKNVKVFDEFICEKELCKALIIDLLRHDYEYVVIITNCLNRELTDRLMPLDCNTSILDFRRNEE